MDSRQLEGFSKLLDMARANYDKPPLSVEIKGLWATELGDYSYQQIQESLLKHIRRSEFAPKLSDVILGIQGTKPKAREILAAARLKNSPFGVLAASHIGSWDLNSLDDYALETRAQEIVDLYNGWSEEYIRGDTSPNMVAIMARSGIMLNAPFRPDGVPPSVDASNKMIAIANTALNQDAADASALRIEQQKIDDITPEQRQDNRKRLLDLVSGLGKPEPSKINDVVCDKCGNGQPEILKTCERCGDVRAC